MLGTQPCKNKIILRVFFTAVICSDKTLTQCAVIYPRNTALLSLASKRCWGSFAVNLDGCHNTDEVLVRAYFFTELLA